MESEQIKEEFYEIYPKYRGRLTVTEDDIVASLRKHKELRDHG